MGGGERRENPFTGPKPLERGDTLYGRDTELDDLLDMLFAERILVLHSPSGAGKSSLLNAGLIPEVLSEEEGGLAGDDSFDLVPVLRLNRLLPPEPGEDRSEGFNRFAVSAMLSVEEELPAEERTPPAGLAGMTLVQYLDRRREARGETRPELIIVDQFEEALTLDRTGTEAKVAFFVQLGQCLRARHRYAIIAIREDYLAALAPYKLRLPTGLRNAFRLDLLGYKGAMEAVQGPAKKAGIPFAGDAARRLVDDLRRVTEMDDAGQARETLGPYVEPVQLQVVCHELFRDLSPETKRIELSLLQDVGDVDQALAGYYAAETEAAAEAAGVNERHVRDWVEQRLISEAGIRIQVLRTNEQAQGLAHAAIERLVNAHLVRAESHRGAIWYELTHDRLVGPVREDNERWRQENLVPLQLQARIWEQKQRPSDLLLRGEALEEAEAWAAEQADEQGPVEKEFLRQSRAAADEERREQERLEAEQRKRELEQARALAQSRAVAARRLAVGLVMSLLLLAAALIATYFAVLNEREATRQRDLAEKRRKEVELEKARVEREKAYNERQFVRLVTYTIGTLKHDPLLATQLLKELEGKPSPIDGVARALELLGEVLPLAVLGGHHGHVTVARYSPDGKRVVTAAKDGTVRVSGSAGRGDTVVFEGHKGAVTDAAFSADSTRMVTASRDGTARIWSLDDPDQSVVLKGHTGKVLCARFSPDGKWVATGSADKTVRLWPSDGSGKATVLKGHSRGVTQVGFSPNGWLLVSASQDRTARIWSPGNKHNPRVLRGHRGAVTAVRFDHKGGRVVTASTDGTARVWSLDEKARPLILADHRGAVTDARFSPDGGRVVTAGGREVHLWVTAPRGQHLVLRGHRGKVLGVDYSPDGKRVASASADGTARIWSAGSGQEQVLLAGHEGKVSTVQFSPKGGHIVTGSDDHTARVWSSAAPTKAVTILAGHVGAVVDADAGPRGQTVTASADGTARVWQVARGRARLAATLKVGAALQSVRLSDDGARVVTTSTDRVARVWRADGQGAPVALKGHTGDLLPARFSRDGALVLTASADGTARVWRADGQGEPFELDGREGPLTCAAFSPDGKQVVTGTEEGVARVWRADGQGSPVKLVGHGAALTAVEFAPGGKRIVTASADGTARVWRADGKGAFVPLAGHKSGLTDARFSPNGTLVVTASEDGTARVWRADGKGGPIVLWGHRSRVTGARFDPTGSRVVTISGDEARVWRADGQGTPVNLEGHGADLTVALFDRKGTRVITASLDNTARLWSVTKTWSDLIKTLVGRTTVCLTRDQRVRYLGQLVSDADTRYAACEKKFGRTVKGGKKAEAKKVRITLMVRPAGSTVMLDGKPVESNPVKLPAAGRRHTLIVSAKGYTSQRRDFLDDGDQTIHITLRPGKAKVEGEGAMAMVPPPTGAALPPPPDLEEIIVPPPPPEPEPEPDLPSAATVAAPPVVAAAKKATPRPKPPPTSAPTKTKKQKKKSIYFKDDL